MIFSQVKYDRHSAASGVQNLHSYLVLVTCSSHLPLTYVWLQELSYNSLLPSKWHGTISMKHSQWWWFMMHAVESFRLGPFKICQDLFPISILCGFLYQVTYCVSGMLEKNRDTLSQNILECLQHSESGMIYELFSSHFSEYGALVVR